MIYLKYININNLFYNMKSIDEMIKERELAKIVNENKKKEDKKIKKENIKKKYLKEKYRNIEKKY